MNRMFRFAREKGLEFITPSPFALLRIDQEVTLLRVFLSIPSYLCCVHQLFFSRSQATKVLESVGLCA